MAEMSPDELRTRAGGQGAKGEIWRRQCGYPTGTPLIDTNCSEPIKSQIGLSDLVSVSDSFKGHGRLEAQRGGMVQGGGN